MNFRIRACVGILVCVLLCAGSSAARTAPFGGEVVPDDLPVSITAERMQLEQRKNQLVAEGAVVISQGERTLRADYISIDLTTRDARARGNVELQERGDRIVCESFDINLDTQLGEVAEAKIFIKEQNIHIHGQDIKRLGLNRYTVQHGRITTCDGTNPAWKIEAGKIDVTVDGYARVRNGVFAVKGVPVAYLPFAVFPVKTTRQSGFLFPEFSHSSGEGFQVNNSFFWAISDNTDATLWLDAATKRGLGTGLEYRFLLGERTSGKMYGYFIEEGNHYFDHEYRDERDRDRTRIYLDFEGEHYFSDNMYVKALTSYVSDREMYGDYRTEIRRSRSNERRGSLRSREKDESVVFLTRNWDTCSLLLNANLYRNMVRSAPETVQRLPRVAFSTMPLEHTGTGLVYRLDSFYDYFWREAGEKAHRFELYPRVSRPRTLGGWLKLVPEVGLHGMTLADVDHDRGQDTSKLFPTLRMELSTTLLRVYSFQDASRLRKLRHSIEPGLLYEYIPSRDQEDVPEFDMPEHFYRRHTLTAYLKHRFTGLLDTASGETAEREIGYVLLGQTLHITPPRGGVYLRGNPDRDFSDIIAEVRLGVFPYAYVKAEAAYNTYASTMRYYNVLCSLSTESGDYAQLQYRYYRDWHEILDLRGSLRLTHFLSVFFDARYDAMDDSDLDTEVGLDYSSQCWGSILSIEASSGTGGRKSDVTLHYSFYLKGLGDRL